MNAQTMRAASTRESTSTARDVAELAGRILLAALFLTSGLGVVGAYSGTAAYMSSVGVPGALLPAVVPTEVIGAVAVIAGWQTRIVAILLAGFTLLTAAIFHNNFGNQIEAIMFLKNIAITGGFLLLVVNGAGPLSIDRRFGN